MSNEQTALSIEDLADCGLLSELDFDGKTYEAPKDRKRLTAQLEVVKNLMLDGKFRTLDQINEETGYPQSSISARLRDLRKPKFGSMKVDRTRSEVIPGLFFYRVSSNV